MGNVCVDIFIPRLLSCHTYKSTKNKEINKAVAGEADRLSLQKLFRKQWSVDLILVEIQFKTEAEVVSYLLKYIHATSAQRRAVVSCGFFREKGIAVFVGVLLYHFIQ